MMVYSTLPATETPNAEVWLYAGLQQRSCKIAVMGLGYVGLPMAVAFAHAGFPVTGIEIDPRRRQQLENGRSYIEDLPSVEIQAVQAQGRFEITSQMTALREADVVLICVPTPLSKSQEPDLTAILDATEAIADHIHSGQLIVLESTTYPGTTEEVLLPRLQRSGLHVGKDFFLAFSSERIDPANKHYGVSNIPKLVGGVTASCGKLVEELYRQIVETVVPVSCPRVAEAAKLLENTFRSVNIALANEMALICRSLGIDVWEVIDAAATKPFGFMPHYPGPGTGGHCIPLDPQYLAWKARLNGYESRFIRLATEINLAMPQQVVTDIIHALKEQGRSMCGSRILIVGVAYKPDVSDCRESPGVEIIRLLQSCGAQVNYSDSHVNSLCEEDIPLRHVALDMAVLRASDCVVIVTHHSDVNYEEIARESRLVVDTRNACRAFVDQGNIRFL